MVSLHPPWSWERGPGGPVCRDQSPRHLQARGDPAVPFLPWTGPGLSEEGRSPPQWKVTQPRAGLGDTECVCAHPSHKSIVLGGRGKQLHARGIQL